MLYEYLIENYEPGEPIFSGDIEIPGMSEENLRYHLKKLTDDGIISRFESGVYYFPKKDIFGEKKSLSAETVAMHKYILRRGKGSATIPDIPWPIAWDCQRRYLLQ